MTNLQHGEMTVTTGGDTWAVQPANGRGVTTGGRMGCYNWRRDGVLQPAEGWGVTTGRGMGGTTGRLMGCYNPWWEGVF